MKSLASMINEELFTSDYFKQIARDHKIKQDQVIRDAPQELKSYIEQYVKTNDKGMIVQIQEQINKYPEIKKAVDFDNHFIRWVYRGLHGCENQTEKEILARETSNWYVATSPDIEVARGYAKTPGVILTYQTEPECIVFTLETFRPILTEFTPEVVVDVRNEWCTFNSMKRV